jgi:hypothetical protein
VDEDRIALADAIDAIRAEMLDAEDRGAGSRLRFAVEHVELEFTVTVSYDAQADVRVRFWVLEAGGGAGASRAGGQIVRVTLRPVGEGGREFLTERQSEYAPGGDTSPSEDESAADRRRSTTVA